MNESTSACPTDEELAQFVSSELETQRAEPIRDHLDDCDSCRAAMLAMVRGSTSASGSFEAKGFSSTPSPGTKIGRFTLDTLLGSGSMGLVFTAHDPELDRSVAIKILRGDDVDEQQTNRMVQEARAMARVRHPHVVTIYDVGRDGDVIFIAMERIRGETFRARTAQGATPVRTALGWLAQAGRGLGAVHAAGLLHRDFKPDNVFVETADNRVVVGDFGLAAHVDRRADSSTDTGSSSTGRSSIPRIDVSRWAGTPAYMAPEQMRNEAIDRRADIFAFGVTAWEMLTGARPFVGATVPAIEDSIAAGARWPSSAPAVPAPVIRMLERCVSYDAAKRPSSIDQVVAVLEAARQPKRLSRRWLRISGAIGIVAVAATTVLAIHARRERHAIIAAARCDAEQPVPWLTKRAEWIRRASSTLSPYVRDSVVALMDQRAQQWPVEAAHACLRDPVVQQAWRLCRTRLERREHEMLDLALEQSWRDDRPLLTFIEGLEQPSYCGSKQASEDAVANSTLHSDQARTTFENGLRILARADAVAALGKRAEVAPLLAQAQVAAAAISPSGLDAEVGLAIAKLMPPAATVELTKLDQDITIAAERSGQASLVARAWLNMVNSSTELVLDERAVDQALTQADWAISRLGDPPRLRAQWDDRAASIEWNRGQRDKARKDFALAAALSTSDPWLERYNHRKLSRLMARLKSPAEALPAYEELIADQKLMDETDARSKSDIYVNYALVLYQIGKNTESIAQLDRARDLLRGVVPDDDPRVFDIDITRATSMTAVNEGSETLALIEHDLPLIKAKLGPDHLLVAQAYDAETTAYMLLGRFEDAVKSSDLASEILRRRLGPQASALVVSRQRGIQARMNLPGDLHHVETMYKQLLDDAEVTFGANTAEWAQLVGPYATLLIDLGEREAARQMMERVVTILTTPNTDPPNTAQSQFLLATLVEPTDHKRAVELAATAKAVWTNAPEYADQLKIVGAWLQQHNH